MLSLSPLPSPRVIIIIEAVVQVLCLLLTTISVICSITTYASPAKVDPHSSTASRRSFKEWELEKQRKMPKQRRTASSSSTTTAGGTFNNNDNNDNNRQDENDLWFNREEYSASNRFGKSIDQVSLDPFRHLMLSSASETTTTATLRFSCHDIFDAINHQQRKNSEGKKTMPRCSVPQLHCVTCHPQTEERFHRFRNKTFSSSSRKIREIINALSFTLHEENTNTNNNNNKKGSHAKTKKNGNNDYDTSENNRFEERNSAGNLYDIIPEGAAEHNIFRLAKNSYVPDEAEKDYISDDVVSKVIVPAIQTVSDWISAKYSTCSSDGAIQLISASLSKKKLPRNLILQKSGILNDDVLRENEAADDDEEKEKKRKLRESLLLARVTNDNDDPASWQIPALMSDVLERRLHRHSKRHSYVTLGELQTVTVQFSYRDSSRVFEVEVERFIHTEYRGPNFVDAGYFKPFAVTSIIPKNIFSIHHHPQGYKNKNNNKKRSSNNNKSSKTTSATMKKFSVLSWNLWHTQSHWLQHRSIGVANWIKKLSPNSVLMQEMRLDNTAGMFMGQAAQWHFHDSLQESREYTRKNSNNDNYHQHYDYYCPDTGGHSEVFSSASYFRHSISMMEHLHRRVRTKIPYFVDMLPAMIYLQDPFNNNKNNNNRNSAPPVIPPGTLQWQWEGLGMMNKPNHIVLDSMKLLLPKIIPKTETNDYHDSRTNSDKKPQLHLDNDQHQRGLFCQALLVPNLEIVAKEGSSTEKEEKEPSSPILSKTIRIDVCTSHFSLNAVARLENAKNVVSAIEHFAKKNMRYFNDETGEQKNYLKATATIFAGDFNAEPDDKAYEYLTSMCEGGKFEDLYQSHHRHNLPLCSKQDYRNSKTGKCLQKESPSSCRCVHNDKGHTFDRRYYSSSKRIDFMMLRNHHYQNFTLRPATPLRYLDADFHQDYNGRGPLSDHVGLFGEFVLEG